MKQNADTLVETLNSFGVQTRIVDIHRGPTVTRYELQPAAGVKISKITGLSDDIALNLAAAGVRIEAPIPWKAAVGVEVPNKIKDIVAIRELIESTEFATAKSKLSFVVGKNIDGDVIIGDISRMPHIIIAGTTGSGKSVCTNSIIMSILYNASPDDVRMVLIDPKMVEFKTYDGIPHLLIPVVTDPRKAAGALSWAVQEMLKRYQLFADRNVRDLTGYNEAALASDFETLPRIVIVIDELADLMMAAANEVEDSICRLAQMARAAGMHLIIATQRPTVDVITGLIKANIPSRIALTVSSQIDSRTIIDTAGAEKLLGNGDMLYYPSGIPKPVRVQGCFVSTKEVEAVVDYIKNEAKTPAETAYSDEIMREIERNMPALKAEKSPVGSDLSTEEVTDADLTDRAAEVLIDAGQASVSYLQRKLKLGYARAARIMDDLEAMGIVGAYEGSKPRSVLVSREQWMTRKLLNHDTVESTE
jgi:S-DNA-T family DNA segregation ATPase FtsK/SpoIIIE